MSEGLAVESLREEETPRAYSIIKNVNARREADRAEQRREALRKHLVDANLTIEEACRRAGLGSKQKPGRRASPGNAVGNFLRRVTDSLNLKTLEPLAASLGCTVSELIGEISVRPIVGRVVPIRGTIDGRTFVAAAEEQEMRSTVLLNGLEPLHPHGELFLLASGEMSSIYPARNTLLVVVPLIHAGPIRNGHRVIVTTTTSDGLRQRLNCREVAHENSDRTCRLATRSKSRRFTNSAIEFPWPITAGSFAMTADNERVEVTGRVVGSIPYVYKPEPDL